MKRLNLNSLVMILALGLAFVSCDKKEDETETTAKSSFTYDGKTYETPSGYIEDYGTDIDGAVGDFDITLHSSSVSYNTTTEELKGTGNAVYLDLNSASLTELSAGTYTYDVAYQMSDSASRMPNTFVGAAVAVGYTFETETGTDDFADETSTGTVTITKAGNVYDISYTFTTAGGKTVTGTYKGALPKYDISDLKSTKESKSKAFGK